MAEQVACVHTHTHTHLCGEQGGEVVQAVAVVVGYQLQHTELAALGQAEVDAQAQAGGGGKGEAQPVALPRHTLHLATAHRQVLQHVSHHQAHLFL